MVLTGLRHFKKDVQGTAFALLYAHRKRDSEIGNSEEGNVVYSLPNIMLIA